LTALVETSGETQRLVAWLTHVADRRDLGLPPPPGPHAHAVGLLLDVLSREFSDYRGIVEAARSAARRNAELLAQVAQSTGEQRSLLRATAQGAAQASDGAARMSDAADSLYTFAQGAASAAADARANIAAIDAALAQLAVRLTESDGPIVRMRESTEGIGSFLLTLARLSRHAQLLAVNASIEAAHLAEAGSRFAIVADEVRKLSTSTRDSKADVARIVGQLREATGHVAESVGDSKDATTAASREVGGAGDALAQTADGIAQFEKMVATVADVASTQRMALESIGTSVDEIARHADEASQASVDAARLDIDALIERALERVGGWKLRSGSFAAEPASAQEPLAAWIGDIAAGRRADRSVVDRDPALRQLATAIESLVETTSASQREILGDLVAAAVAVSRNSYAWRSIATSLAGVGSEIGVVRATADESARGARISAELAAAMRALVDTIRSRHDSALELLEGALAQISRIGDSVGQIDGFVASMGAAAARADEIMGLIETLSAETDLLSLNAAIEAAHAGELGFGFGVIAEEIRALARSTNESTLNVTLLVSNVSLISAELQTSIGAAAAGMTDVVAGAESVRSAIAALRASFESTLERAAEVSASAGEQSRALDRVLDNINRSSSAADGNAAETTDRGRLELAMLGSRAHAIAARRPLGTVVERVRAFTEGLSERIEAAIETRLAANRTGIERLFDLSYHEIEGREIATLARLFDVSRVPAGGFAPAKYATPWDATIDEAIIEVMTSAWDEAAAAAFSPVTIFLSDLNGFFYAYPRQKIAGWQNDPPADNLGNRIKRLFEDEYTLRVVRTGMGPEALQCGPRTSYEAFRLAGCALERAAERPWGAYVYARDTSAVCNEVVMAIYARGRRHGAVRVCYDPTLI
jgi:methyl-accepting chemotaxis protein